MTTETVVAVFDTDTLANDAIRALQEAGFPAASIQHYAKGSPAFQTGSETSGNPRQGFWGWLLGEEGAPVHEDSVYERTVEGGGTVVTVVTDDTRAPTVMAILEEHSPVDIDERAAQYGLAGPSQKSDAATRTPAANIYGASESGTVRQPGTAAGEASVRGAEADQVMQLSEESLDVGKRAVTRGTTRIRRYVVERPVEEQIRLREERVSIERRPVTGGAAVTGDAFTEKTIEMTKRGEEAVVGKTARVVGEIGIRKEVTERVETVRDTVRRDEVEIQEAGQRGPTVSGAASVSGSASVPGPR